MSESVQWALLLPSLLLVVLGGLQVGLGWHARNVAQQAADAAVETAAVAGTHGSAQRVAAQVAAAGDLRNVQVSVTESSTQVSAEVTGRPVSLCPSSVCGDLLTVRAAATFPKERR